MTSVANAASPVAKRFEPEQQLIDTHVHLWNLQHPQLRWNWIDTDDDHPVLGNIDPIKMRAFEMSHLEAESRFASVSGFVHVQAAIGSPDPVVETKWLSQLAAGHPKLRAIVGHVDLGTPEASHQLAGHLAYPLFRGVRDFALEPYLASGEVSQRFEESLAELARANLVLDMDCEYPNMAQATALARRHPQLTIVLEHIGFPRSRDAEYLRNWQRAISQLATAPNVVCKLSGVAMTDRQFTFDSLAPWVRHCIDEFGPDRIMVGSNWPLDRMVSSYDAIMNHLRAFIAEYDEAEQAAMLRDTATRVYRIEQI